MHTCILFYIAIAVKISYYTTLQGLHPGADLGFSERGAKRSSESLKQRIWGPQKLAIEYFVF